MTAAQGLHQLVARPRADCGRFMNSLYEQAREIVANELNAPSDEYAVIFTGSGATAGLDKLTRALLDKHKDTLAAAAEGKALPPVVFVGPHEHHSNEVLWRERHCTVKVRISMVRHIVIHAAHFS
jgi:selenocysteine lyase/cysteine desulfurase